MEHVITIALAWILFAATHIGLAAAPISDPLRAKLGAQGFLALFSVVAVITLGLLVNLYAGASTLGPAGLALGRIEGVRFALIGLSGFGVVCIIAALTDYPLSAYAMSSAGQKPEPRGFERITRHGFAIGLSLVAVAHALLATKLTGTVFFSALALFGILGSMHQDAKLRARHTEEHSEYLAKTSLFPFVAILAGRNRLVLAELRTSGLIAGLVVAWMLREAHPSIFAGGGIYVMATVVGGAMLATIQDARRAKRKARTRNAPPSSLHPHHAA